MKRFWSRSFRLRKSTDSAIVSERTATMKTDWVRRSKRVERYRPRGAGATGPRTKYREPATKRSDLRTAAPPHPQFDSNVQFTAEFGLSTQMNAIPPR